MKEVLKEISAENDHDFYYNAENIPNQDLVFATFEFFDTGERKGVFNPLNFMNLLWKQYNFVCENIEKSYSTLNTLKELPLNNEQKHILYGFILKWFGGYPINNMNTQFNSTLRLIEKEFLSYEGDTPEKEFCNKNFLEYKRNRQLEIIMADDIKDIITGLEGEPALKPKKEDVTIELKDFFNGVDEDTIKSIQDEFKEYKGKRLAMLLHRLVDLKLVSYLPNSKTKSRKHFVKLFKNEDYSLSYVNNALSDKNELKKHPTNDHDYIDIKEKLSKALEKVVF